VPPKLTARVLLRYLVGNASLFVLDCPGVEDRSRSSAQPVGAGILLSSLIDWPLAHSVGVPRSCSRLNRSLGAGVLPNRRCLVAPLTTQTFTAIDNR
jgi:hypothetical protein